MWNVTQGLVTEEAVCGQGSTARRATPVQRFCGKTHACIGGQQDASRDWSGGDVHVYVSFMVFETESHAAQDSFELAT